MKADIKKYVSYDDYHNIIEKAKRFKQFDYEVKIGNGKFSIDGRKCDNGLWENNYVICVNFSNNTSGQGCGYNLSEINKMFPTYESFVDYVKGIITRYEDVQFEEDLQMCMF